MSLDILSKIFLLQDDSKLELEARFGTMHPDKLKESVQYKKGLSKNVVNNFPDFIDRNKGLNRIKKIDFDNVIRYIKSIGFNVETTSETLKIVVQETTSSGLLRNSNIRTEIVGAQNIHDYCTSNSIMTTDEKTGSLVIKPYVLFTKKRRTLYNDINFIPESEQLVVGEFRDGNKKVNTFYDVPEFNFRVSLQYDEPIARESEVISEFSKLWEDKKKTFRLLKRYEFIHPDYPYLKIHMSIVRSSKRNQSGKIMPTFDIKESNVLFQNEEYEIEIEATKKGQQNVDKRETVDDEDSFDSLKMSSLSASSSSNRNKISTAKFVKQMKTVIKYVLSGLQNTKYPINMFEYYEALNGYNKLTQNVSYDFSRFVNTKMFIGPSSISLEMKNLIPIEKNIEVGVVDNPDKDDEDDEENAIVEHYATKMDYSNTILKHYTVTDKADGERRLLFINDTGKIYTIDTNMNIYFTGLKTDKSSHFNSLLDGEYVPLNKRGEFINLYAGFDIYFWNGEDQRNKPFTRCHDEYMKTDKAGRPIFSHYRLAQLSEFIKTLGQYTEITTTNQMRIERKRFEYGSLSDVKDIETGAKHKTIFEVCNTLLLSEKRGDYEYETDGLIFTPANFGVGMSENDSAIKNSKITWLKSFKWKPPKYNTVDFFVTTLKDGNKDKVTNVYESGIQLDIGAGDEIQSYKTLMLRVGYDINKHGYQNPYKMVIDDILPEYKELDDNSTYRPVLFQPSKYYEPDNGDKPYICNMMLKTIGTDNKVMVAEDGEVIEDEMIVECAFVPKEKQGWQWKPLRVRYDKTAEYRAGLKNYGNAFHVAESVWNSIHNPISEHMLTTGDSIPNSMTDEDVYYNFTRDKKQSKTRSLRDFHNLYVKNKLITSVGKMRNVHNLMDMAVGKAGDLPKWTEGRYKFVFGVDIADDNIKNRIDGACARYLNSLRTNPHTPQCLFVRGDSGLNIRNGDALFSDLAKDIVYGVFGDSHINKAELPKGVAKSYGRLQDGADVISCQFALHYMFKSTMTLHNFMRNLSECCKTGGYFIGTCYDGKTVYSKMLNNIEKGQYATGLIKKDKVWEIRKQFDYEHDQLQDDDSSIGLAIDVFQESINKEFREYLVNFDYFKELMNVYGFALLNNDDARRIGLPNNTGLFGELYNSMKNQIAFEENKYPRSNLKLKVGRATLLEESDAEREISFVNRYFVFKKVRTVNTKNLTEALNTQKLEEVVKERVDDITKKIADEMTADEEEIEEKEESNKKLEESKEKSKDEIMVEEPDEDEIEEPEEDEEEIEKIDKDEESDDEVEYTGNKTKVPRKLTLIN